MLKEHQLELKDDFKIVSNKTSGIGDFCHRFELTFSPHDKQELLNRIITAPTFKESVPEDFNIRTGKPRYANHDTSFTAYYQSKLSYVYEFYQPNKQGYKPTWNRISISKIENKLAYELIQD